MLNVSCAFIIHHRKILVAQNSPRANQPEKWEFPGGKIKPRETAEACIIREIYEELALNISVVQQLQEVEFDYGEQTIRLIPFVCEIKGGSMQLNVHQAVKWTTFDFLPEFDLAAADRALLAISVNTEWLKKHLGKQVNKSG